MKAKLLDPPSDAQFLENLVDQAPTESGPDKVSEYIHGRRIMPPGTPLPGIVDIHRTPYLIEIIDSMSPSSPVQEVSVMKSVQSALTFGAECIIAAWCGCWPTKVLYLTATDKALKKWTKRLEAVIDSCGLRDKIVSSITEKKSRVTGDKALSKTFAGGGALEMGSLQSSSDLASDSVQVALADEIDRAPEMLKTGEGNFLQVLWGRLENFLWKRKLMAFSTPTTWELSLIFKRFKMGDQREYYVPCKHCGHMFFMEFKMLQPIYDKKGFLNYVWLKCPECEGKIFNSDKTEMLARGKWRPTAIPSSKYHRSYHITRMMVPVGLATWTNVYQEYLNALKTQDGMRAFYNLQLGLPYKESGSRPRWNNIDEFTGGYGEREIPEGVLFITIAMDVQQGSKTDLEKPPRLEMEVVGHGKNFRTWGIEYKVFVDPLGKEGTGITDPSGGAWQTFVEWAQTEGQGFSYFRKNGSRVIPTMMFIDSKDGVTMDIVYQFTQRPDVTGWTAWGLNVYPIKGEGFFKKNKDILGDEPGLYNMLKYKPAKNPRSGDVVYYRIATNHYKKNIYNNLKLKRETDPTKQQRMGFCDFPSGASGYDNHYFKMLTSEEMHSDGSFHKTAYANEALDCRVYALCAADVYLDMLVALERESVRKKVGVSQAQVSVINRLFILNMIETSIGRA